MAKLNQIIAIEKGIKSKAYSWISELHKAIQKPDLFNGFSKAYQAKDDDGEKLPEEKKRVQYVVDDVLPLPPRVGGMKMEIHQMTISQLRAQRKLLLKTKTKIGAIKRKNQIAAIDAWINKRRREEQNGRIGKAYR